MGKLIDPSKKHNHRWKVDPRYEQGFDYDDPKYADVQDELKWALPIHEATETPEYKARANKLNEESKVRVKREYRLRNISIQKP